ncbi:multidrug effflux MFS transporter [Labrenzia sp. 011]|uniref:multidrug effflux MFS transporter n=1 Tax=Labrenzia sp. 011 TaxID=2171494 RepID=UPI000D522C64|nr:multidrug effflux MFS transporter [Labrenzia sp. 011]PVB59391.1 Bcr/CflA family drug resistance efflux transporter [Labrenzia sp. 011]
MHPTTPSPRHAAAITAVLGLLSLFPPLATDMYLAAMGDLAEAMNATHSAAELSLSLFFLGLCAGQLLMGPLIESYGRKTPLLIGTGIFLLTSIVLPLVDNIALFNSLRFLQAIGACAGMVVGRAVVSDLYEGQRAAKVMTVLVMLLTIGPIISPTLGSLLLVNFGWRSIFLVMAAVSAVAIILSQLVIPETLPPEKRAGAAFSTGLKTAGRLLGRAQFVRSAVIAGLVQGGMFAFITGSSGVFQGAFGLDALAYGLVFAVTAIALVIFAQANHLLLNRFSSTQILRRGLPVFVLAGLCLVLVAHTRTIWVFMLPLWLAIGMVGLLSANAMSLAMAQAREGAGMGSALLGAIQFGIAFTVSTCVALGGSATPLPMALGILLPGALAMFLSLTEQAGERGEESYSGT